MKKKVVVFGSYVADLTSRQNGFPIPGQTIRGSSFTIGPGGKGSNQAVAAHRAGADVQLITKLGKDMFAELALAFYRHEGIATDCISISEADETGVALILVDENSAQNEIVVIPGACDRFTLEDVACYKQTICSADILLVQLEINFDALQAVVQIAHDAGVFIVLNPAPTIALEDEFLAMIDLITPNETEAEALTGIHIQSFQEARRAAALLLTKGAKQVVITLGKMGSLGTNGQQYWIMESLDVEVVDTTGAGDAFNGSLVTALAQGCDLPAALRYANAAGALCVTKQGTAPAMPMRSAIEKLVSQYNPQTHSKKM